MSYPAWYAINYYAAGLIDQELLVVFDMQEDFEYCQKWHPQKSELIDLYSRLIKTDELSEKEKIHAQLFRYYENK